MPRFTYTADTSVPPSRVLAALTDFSDHRLRLWPTIDKRYYAVHSLRTHLQMCPKAAPFSAA
jgi:hypothetical protein